MKATLENLDNDARTAILAEYTALRAENLKRLEMRQQYVSIVFTIASVFLGVGLGTPTVALVFPPIAAVLAITWNQNEYRIRMVGAHIRNYHEGLISGLYWETQIREESANRLHRPLYDQIWRSLMISNAGVFVFVEFAALVLGLLGFSHTPTEWILLVTDMFAIVFTVWIFLMGRENSKERQDAESENTQ